MSVDAFAQVIQESDTRGLLLKETHIPAPVVRAFSLVEISALQKKSNVSWFKSIPEYIPTRFE